MKKTLAIALVLVMCLSLTACGQQERYPEIADMLDAGNYEGAIWAIYQLYQENNTTEATEPEPTVDPQIQRKYNTLTYALDSLVYFQENQYNLATFSFSHYNGEEYIHYEGFEAIQWLYDTALELGDYENAAQIAAGFTVLEDVALHKVYWYEDALGNINQTNRIYYIYAADGTLVKQDTDSYAIGDNYLYNYGTPEYIYDENGMLATLRYLSNDLVNCIIDYTYNDDGTLATEHYLDRSGNEYTVTYTYENGVLVQSSGNPYYEGSEKTMTVVYLYDDQGRLVREEGISETWEDTGWTKYVKTVDYTYDDAGNLLSVRKATEYYTKDNSTDAERYLSQYQEVRVWEYTYDDAGRLIQNTYANIGNTDPNGIPENEDYRTYIGDTTYGTYYVYTPAE